MSRARYFADVNVLRPASYWDYENFSVDWGDPSEYEAKRKIGRGKYSEVFEGKSVLNGGKCVIKLLKPVRKMKIQREIKILQSLCGGPNIVSLLDVVRDPVTRTTGLVFEYVSDSDFKSVYSSLSDLDVRHYMFQILQALQHSHSNGIIHRDVKPQNMMVNVEDRQLRLIDWGLAEYYHPGMQYNVRVASRYFKGPELLVGLRDYDYSLDMWSFGCVFAGLIFQKEPFFHGLDNTDQLVKIAQVLGTAKLYKYLERYDLELDSAFDGLLGEYPALEYSEFVTQRNSEYAKADALDLVDKLLRYDHMERLSPEEAMAHPYFDSVRPEEDLPPVEYEEYDEEYPAEPSVPKLQPTASFYQLNTAPAEVLSPTEAYTVSTAGGYSLGEVTSTAVFEGKLQEETTGAIEFLPDVRAEAKGYTI